MAKSLWGGLEVSSLDATAPSWLAASTVAVATFFDQAGMAATRYVSSYRQAEIRTRSGDVEPARWNETATQGALMLAGPIRIKSLIGSGVDPTEATRTAYKGLSGLVRKQIMAGGRDTIANTARADHRAIGFRRVTDGNPCAFCAMLASRGPSYGSAAVARARSDGMRYHNHCGCSAEIVYGSWQPTAAEQGYLDAYKLARIELEEAGIRPDARSIVQTMRASGSFRDSPRNS